MIFRERAIRLRSTVNSGDGWLPEIQKAVLATESRFQKFHLIREYASVR